jgi:hypothetical protein
MSQTNNLLHKKLIYNQAKSLKQNTICVMVILDLINCLIHINLPSEDNLLTGSGRVTWGNSWPNFSICVLISHRIVVYFGGCKILRIRVEKVYNKWVTVRLLLHNMEERNDATNNKRNQVLIWSLWSFL